MEIIMALHRNLILTTLTVMLLGACANQSSAPGNPAQPETVVSEKTDHFVGEITALNAEQDGYSVTVTNKEIEKSLNVVLSVPNLGSDSEFDFTHIEKGNILKVYGEIYEFNGGMSMSAKRAKSFIPIEFKGRQATSSERKQCELLGGSIKKSGRAQFDKCIQSFSDAGEYCEEAIDCFGRCTLASSADHAKIGDAVDGVCEADNSRFGCTPLVSGGKYEGTICID